MVLICMSYISVDAANLAVDNSFENNQWVDSLTYQGEGIWHSDGFQRTTDYAYDGAWSASTIEADTTANLYQIVQGTGATIIPTLSLSYIGIYPACINCYNAQILIHRLFEDPVIGENIQTTGNPQNLWAFGAQNLWTLDYWQTNSHTFNEYYGTSWYRIQLVGRNSAIDNVSFDATPVVPEPISSTLFLVGSATLGLARFRKRKK